MIRRLPVFLCSTESTGPQIKSISLAILIGFILAMQYSSLLLVINTYLVVGGRSSWFPGAFRLILAYVVGIAVLVLIIGEGSGDDRDVIA